MAPLYLLRPNDLAKDGLDDPWFDATDEELAAIEDAVTPPKRALRMPLALVGFALAIGLFVTAV